MEGSGRGLVWGNCLKGLRKTKRNFVHRSRSPDVNFNPGPSECEAALLSARSQGSVNIPVLRLLNSWHQINKRCTEIVHTSVELNVRNERWWLTLYIYYNCTVSYCQNGNRICVNLDRCNTKITEIFQFFVVINIQQTPWQSTHNVYCRGQHVSFVSSKLPY